MNYKVMIVAAAVLSCFASSASAQTGKLELFADRNASSCQLTDAPGLISIFVFQTAGNSTAIGAFRVIRPDCWNATYAGESEFPNPGHAGSSQTDGVSVPFGACKAPPIFVIQIFFLSAGTSGPCCNLVATAVPGFEYSDCNFIDRPAVIGHGITINPNSSCACGGPLATEPTTWGRVKSLYR
jgi:hypothetical protein